MHRIYVFSLIMFMFLGSNSQTIISEGTVAGIWDSIHSPYLIEGDITLSSDSSLIIEPGVEIVFQGHFDFQVYGVLQAVGTREDSISFTINDTSGFAQTDNYSSGWGGIQFIDRAQSNDTSVLKFCRIEYTVPDTVISIYNNDYGSIYTRNYASTVVLENCWIRNNRGCVHSYFGNMTVLNCIVSNNIGGGLRMIFNSGLIYGNIVTENISTDNMIGGMFFAGHPKIYNNTICFNAATNGGGITLSDDGGTLTVYNSILFGNEATLGAGSMAYSAWSWIQFKNCILEGIYLGDPGEDTLSVNTTNYNDLFENTNYPVYRLTENSIAIDSGLNDILFNQKLLVHPEFDVIGNPRIQNHRIDVGAIETAPYSFLPENSSDMTSFCVYPNPATTHIILDVKDFNFSSVEISVINMQGIKVLEESLNKPLIHIDITSLSKGVYILTMKTETTFQNHLFIKR